MRSPEGVGPQDTGTEPLPAALRSPFGGKGYDFRSSSINAYAPTIRDP
jgi:hypothetical protein